ncbi:MAG: gliding motility-associated C-terminal domain-containing protein [Saprospirales bacterium]|nr:MAG: gliding motility-associated C-terminal domain-containing protein [Saprospirales bacterium]
MTLRRILEAIIFFLIILAPNCLIAGFYSGGEISYHCRGGNLFDIELKVYWDCNINSSSNPLPQTTELRFYFLSSNNQATAVGNNGSISLQFSEIGEIVDTIMREGQCDFVPKFACKKYGIYKGSVILPFSFEGYYLVSDFERRTPLGSIVNTITNIEVITPNDGPVLTAEIHSRALIACESSAELRDIEQLYFCINEPINIDASVLKSEFDSIVYKFYHPFYNTWPAPPLNKVRFSDGFRLTNLMGGPDPLVIDRHTGKISGTPVNQGIFLIGISIHQYNGNQLSGVLNREFFMYVGDCGHLNADFGVDDFYCEPPRLEVAFIDITVNFLSSIWILGDLENPISTFSNDRPVINFPHFGEFLLTRIVYGPNPSCNDTISKVVDIRKDEVGAFTEVEWGECTKDSIEFTIRGGTSTIPLSELDFELGVYFGSNSYYVQDSIFTFKIPNRYSIIPNIIIHSAEWCAPYYFQHVQTGFIFNSEYEAAYFLCEGSLALDDHYDDRNNNHNFDWDPRDGILNNEWDIQNPTVSPDTSTTYIGTASLENCSGEFTYHIEVFKPGTPFLPDTICGRQYQVTYNPFNGFARNYVWRYYQNGIRVGSRIDTFPLISMPNFGNAIIELEPFGFDGINCPDTIVQEVYFFEPSVDWDIELDVLECSDSISLIISGISNGTFIGREEYILISPYTDTLVSSRPEFQINTPLLETIEFTLLLTTDRGCIIEESFALPTPYLPDLYSIDSIGVCQGDTLFLSFEMEEGMQIEWLSEAEFIGDPNEFPLAFLPDSSQLLIMGIEFLGCEYQYEFDITVFGPGELELGEILICDDDLNQHLDFFNILAKGPEKWTIRDENGVSIASGDSGVAEVEFPDFSEYELWLYYPSDEYICGLLGLSSVTLTESGQWNVEISVLEEDCIGQRVNLHLFKQLIHNHEKDWDFQSRWVVINGDTMIFAGDSLRVTLDGLSEIEILLEVNDQFGCKTIANQLFQYQFIEAEPPMDSLSICRGEEVELWPGAPAELEYVWSPAFGLIGGITEPSPLAAPPDNTKYRVEISGGDCSNQFFVNLVVHPLPEFNEISANPSIISPGEESFLLLNPGDNVKEIIWFPPEFLDNPHVFNPVASPRQTTLYTAYLISEKECVDSIQVEVEVIDFSCAHPFVFLPSAFSPNGDGQNDVLYIRGQTILNSELIIYDRMGRQVFNADGVNHGWDGTAHGKEVPAGVYAFTLFVECENGDYLRSNGNVSLIR